MKIKIHRGTQEIGGTCIEIWTDRARIILDIGMPLVNEDGSDFRFDEYRNLTPAQLRSQNILPDISGIYKEDKTLVDAVLISHAHYDHFGFSQFLHDDLLYYLSEGSHRLIQLTSRFTPHTDNIRNVEYVKNRESFWIKDLKITPFLIDHSAFDAFAFQIEHEGKKVFYSGDFRGHGRKWELFREFINKAEKVDCLLLEGTTIGRSGEELSEMDVEKKLVQNFCEAKPNLVYASGQNIDRLVSIYRAALQSGKTLVVDLYIAMVLRKLAELRPSIPYPGGSWKQLKVWYTRGLSKKIAGENISDLYQFKNRKISKEELDRDPGKYIIMVRPYLKHYFRERMLNIRGGNLIYSFWPGYIKKDNPALTEFLDFLQNERGFMLHHNHSSGHAYTGTIRRLAQALSPDRIIPIHTDRPLEFDAILKNVCHLRDGEIFEI